MDDQVREALVRYRTGNATAAELADELGVNRRTVYNWVEGEARAHVLASLS